MKNWFREKIGSAKFCFQKCKALFYLYCNASVIQLNKPTTIERPFYKARPMPVIIKTSVLLIMSNFFMTFAWYAHLKNLAGKKWYIAAVVSWGIAFFEYMIQVPANRIGYSELSLSQLKILQEIITLSVFVPFAIVYMHQPMKLNYLWAGLCLVAAAYFIFKT